MQGNKSDLYLRVTITVDTSRLREAWLQRILKRPPGRLRQAVKVRHVAAMSFSHGLSWSLRM
jgi:hypothetical protein